MWLVITFNQHSALIGAFIVIVKLHEGSFAALADTALDWTRWTRNNTIITNVLFRECWWEDLLSFEALHRHPECDSKAHKYHYLQNTAQCNPCPFKMSFNQNCWTTKNSYANEFDHLHKKCYFPGAGDRRRIDRNSIFCISAADPGPAAAGLGWPSPPDTRHGAAPLLHPANMSGSVSAQLYTLFSFTLGVRNW